jgi:hypothetical protein
MSASWLDLGWPGLILWAALFAGDYALTLWGARLYRQRAHEVIRFEGSYELTPVYRADIDSLRKFSPRFAFALVFSTGALALIWWTGRTGLTGPEWFAFGLGALMLREVPVYTRHFQNIVFYRNFDQLRVAPGSRLEYPRRLIYRLSSVDMAVAGGGYLVLAALLRSSFFLGGAIGCAGLGLQHFFWARRSSPSDSPGVTLDPS